MMPGFDLAELAATIAERARAGGERSYTRKLLDEGIEKCAKKLGEEATETVVAALSSDKRALINESADLLYHLLVVLEARGVKLDEVYAELARRTGQSGLEEKAARAKR
jgi:phosphoribosyl-ATP pyrophosphohydrolase